jgi:spore coat protein CotH
MGKSLGINYRIYRNDIMSIMDIMEWEMNLRWFWDVLLEVPRKL